MRQETCYLDYRHGQCSNSIEGQFSKSLCCCSVGRAWGSERCESCPKPGTHAHLELCPRGGGFTDRQDINECIEFPGMCLNGRCKNTIGSFGCKCNQGFALDEHGIKCNGMLLRTADRVIQIFITQRYSYIQSSCNIQCNRFCMSIVVCPQTSMNARSCTECAETAPAETRLETFSAIAIPAIAAVT